METGVKETKELLTGLIVITKVIAKELKDGFSAQDLVDAFVAVQGDEVKKAAVEAALKDIVAVPAEVKDLKLSETLELVVHLLAELPALLAAFKAPEAVVAPEVVA
jgi:hypothetical protein